MKQEQTEVKEVPGLFGWCNDGHHKNCRKRYQRSYMGTVREGRKKVEKVIYLDEWRVCNCSCHKDTTKKTAKKKPVRRKSK